MGEEPKIVDSTRDQYNYHMRRGLSWYRTAAMLKTAADKILDAHLKALQSCKLENEDMKLFPAYMLLMGYALEDLVKGIIILEMWFRDRRFFDKNFDKMNVPTKDGSRHAWIKSHEIDDLFDAEVVGIVITEKEKRVLKEIKKYVIWGGKYPIPKECNGDNDEAVLWGIIYFRDDELSMIKSIYDKAYAELVRLDNEQIQVLEVANTDGKSHI